MTLTKETINEYREYLYQLSSDGEHPRMVDTLCDMALKTLSAPAPLSSEAALEAKMEGAAWALEAYAQLGLKLTESMKAALLAPSPSEKEKP